MSVSETSSEADKVRTPANIQKQVEDTEMYEDFIRDFRHQIRKMKKALRGSSKEVRSMKDKLVKSGQSLPNYENVNAETMLPPNEVVIRMRSPDIFDRT